ncbi:Type I iodothyronine deiodinase [Trichoplax sp. H2]|nr:Type I iodothyronine deiodinase [Trichoplax sp. H2]|eukprot:RDD44194.1 Type I iodothyronine deiodinase [Trichoplax sp. H2]
MAFVDGLKSWLLALYGLLVFIRLNWICFIHNPIIWIKYYRQLIANSPRINIFYWMDRDTLGRLGQDQSAYIQYGTLKIGKQAPAGKLYTINKGVTNIHQIIQESNKKLAVLNFAHATDGWRLSGMNEDLGICFKQPKTLEDRMKVAQAFIQNSSFQHAIVVDDIDDTTSNLYDAVPERLYVVSDDYKILYKGGPGPYGYNFDDLTQSLHKLLA